MKTVNSQRHHLCRYLTYDCLYHCAEWTDSVDEYCNRKELQSKDRICQILRPTITEDPRPLFFSNSYLRNLKAKQAWLEDPPFQLKVVPQPAMQRHFSLSILFLGVFSWSCFHLLPISSLWGKKTSFFVFLSNLVLIEPTWLQLKAENSVKLQ